MAFISNLRLAMGKNARKLAEEAYSFEHYTPLLIERLKFLAAGKNNSPEAPDRRHAGHYPA